MEPTNQPPVKNNPYAIPLAIVIAGLLIGGALIYSNKNGVNDNSKSLAATEEALPQETVEPVVIPVKTEDHILGTENADIIMVEYSDTECPFCKIFHTTLHKVIEKFGKEGKVAWVYRPFPIAELHPKSAKESEATECAGEISGNQKFWQYTDRLYEITPSNNGLDPLKLNDIAKEINIDSTAFDTCLNSGKYAKKIDDSVLEAQKAGGRGTPHVILILKNALAKNEQLRIASAVKSELQKLSPNSNIPDNLVYFFKDGKKVMFTGAFPYEMVNAIVENILISK